MYELDIGLIWFDSILQCSFYHLVQTALIKFIDKSFPQSFINLLAAICRNRIIPLSNFISFIILSLSFEF